LSNENDPLHWYSYPAFYDLGFRDETKSEADFFEAAFAKYVQGNVKTLLEPGCGSGRLVVEMAARGYDVTGFDLNADSLRYLKQRLKRRKLTADVKLADMARFSIGRTYDAAFNTFNTFRHLLDESSALNHLKCVAEHVRPGGIFILGFHLLPPDADPIDCERWKARHGKTEVVYTLRVLNADSRKRIENLRISMLVKSPQSTQKLRAEFPLRTYNVAQLRKLLAKAPQWQLCDVYDFWYDISEPLKLDNTIADTVLILRRR
jgi:SAM-dependent methyltransferase